MTTRLTDPAAPTKAIRSTVEPEVLAPDSIDEDTEASIDFSPRELDDQDAFIPSPGEDTEIIIDAEDPDIDDQTQSRLPALSGGHDALRLYLQEMGRFPMLDPDEEYALARKVRDEHDNAAAFRLISSHLRLVVRIAFDFQRRWMQNVMDLIQEGNVGLMHAVNKFDPDKGIKFSYYASFWIRAYILKFIMDNWRMVKIGTTQAQRKLFYNLNRERRELIAEGFDPDAAMLANRLGVDEKQIIEMQQRLESSDLSLNAPVGMDDANGSTHMDFLPAPDMAPEQEYADREVAAIVRERLHAIIPRLSDKERFILENRLLTDTPVTLREIGEKYHVTRERVRQLEARLLQKLKTHLGDGLPDFETAFAKDDE